MSTVEFDRPPSLGALANHDDDGNNNKKKRFNEQSNGRARAL